MLIIEIALGIILAVLLLANWRALLGVGLVAIVVGLFVLLAIVMAVFVSANAREVSESVLGLSLLGALVGLVVLVLRPLNAAKARRELAQQLEQEQTHHKASGEISSPDLKGPASPT